MQLNIQNTKEFTNTKDLYPEVNVEKSLYLHGDTGVGKTFKTKQLASKLLVESEGLVDIQYSTFSDICQLSIETFSKDNHTRLEAKMSIKDYKECFLLIIDDLATEKVSSHKNQLLYDIINYRVENNLPFFITSNSCLDELESLYSSKITRRIKDACVSLECNRIPPIARKVKIKLPSKEIEKSEVKKNLPYNERITKSINTAISFLVELKKWVKPETLLRYYYLCKVNNEPMSKYISSLEKVSCENIQQKISELECIYPYTKKTI